MHSVRRRSLGSVGVAAVVSLLAALFPQTSPAFGYPGYPTATRSFYVRSSNPADLFQQGCMSGLEVTTNSSPEIGTIILAFGRAAHNGTSYGTLLTNLDSTFVSTTDIEMLAWAFGYGYWACSGGVGALRIAVGTSNNESQAAGTPFNYDHGVEWANMINGLELLLLIAGQFNVYATGAVDLEVDWGPPGPSYDWVTGYRTNTGWPYVDFGAADGCPWDGTGGICRTEDDQHNPRPWYWTQGHRAELASLGNVWPQIYDPAAFSARQWKWLRVTNGNLQLDGVLTTRGTCSVQPGGCQAHEANTPTEALAQVQSIIGWPNFLRQTDMHSLEGI